MTTMIADPPSKTPRLGVGFDSNRPRSPEKDAWKKNIGTRPVSARLALLPESKTRWDRVGVSAGIQLAVLVFLVLLPLAFPESIHTALHYDIVELAQPITHIPIAPPPPKVRPKVAPPQPKPIEPMKLSPHQPHIFLDVKALRPKVHTVEVKAPEMNPMLEAARIETTEMKQPKRPRDPVKLDSFNTGSAAPATVKAPVDKVQTGGFGDPTGLPGKGDPNRGNIVNRKGLESLPGGFGYGNGTAGAKGIRGTVASSGFGNDTAIPPNGNDHRGTVKTGGFGNETVAAAAPKRKALNEGPADTPVSILYKPRPEYTAEGRNLKLEGDVVLDVVFLSDGRVQVNRVVSGLGHGLDESAVRAAELIKFKPALRDGQPVNYPARVRIEFRLAY
jgi:TonB family protein